MRTKLILLAVVLLAAAPLPLGAVSKEIIQLQRDIALLNEQLRDLNRLITERMAVMTQLVEKSNDTTNKLQGSIDNVQRTLQTAIAAQGQKIDGFQSQFQALSEGLEEVKTRQTRLSEQMTQVRQLLEAIQAPAQPAGQPTTPAPAPPPQPEVLYQNALRDFMGGKSDLAMQGFQDYLKHYADGDLAGNAQFYIGEVYYRNTQLSKAVDAYNAVLENYPKSNKTAAAHLKKGYALLELKQRDAGVRELRALIRRFPNSDEARLARERLKTMGLSASARGPTRDSRSARSARSRN